MATATSSRKLENPFSAGALKSLLPQPCTLVIFGGDGDLAWRKLLQAVNNHNVDGVLPSHFAVVGFGIASTEEGRMAADPDEYIRKRGKEGITKFSRQPLDEDHWNDFARGLFFVPGSFADMAAYKKLQPKLAEVDHLFGIPGSRIYYLSIPPQLVQQPVPHLLSAGLVADPG